MKITKGDWVFAKHEQPSQWHGNIIAKLGKVDGIMNIRIIACLTKYCKEDEQDDNAALIAEAGTVHNETGYTPRQLAEQKKALLDACEALLAIQDTDSMFRLPANLPEISNMRAAIAATTK